MKVRAGSIVGNTAPNSAIETDGIDRAPEKAADHHR